VRNGTKLSHYFLGKEREDWSVGIFGIVKDCSGEELPSKALRKFLEEKSLQNKLLFEKRRERDLRIF